MRPLLPDDTFTAASDIGRLLSTTSELLPLSHGMFGKAPQPTGQRTQVKSGEGGAGVQEGNHKY